jgi:hypothetical protein
MALGEVTDSYLAWTDTAGLRQVHKQTGDSEDLRLELIRRAYD